MRIEIETTCKFKGKTIVRFNIDEICYYIFIVGDRERTFGSIADAKRFLNGQPTTWCIVPMWDAMKDTVEKVEAMLQTASHTKTE